MSLNLFVFILDSYLMVLRTRTWVYAHEWPWKCSGDLCLVQGIPTSMARSLSLTYHLLSNLCFLGGAVHWGQTYHFRGITAGGGLGTVCGISVQSGFESMQLHLCLSSWFLCKLYHQWHNFLDYRMNHLNILSITYINYIYYLDICAIFLISLVDWPMTTFFPLSTLKT